MPIDVKFGRPFGVNVEAKLLSEPNIKTEDSIASETEDSLASSEPYSTYRQLAPQLKTLIVPWLSCRFDAQHDVRRSAIAAFEAAFPNPARYAQALSYCRVELVSALSVAALTPPPPKASAPPAVLFSTAASLSVKDP